MIIMDIQPNKDEINLQYFDPYGKNDQGKIDTLVDYLKTEHQTKTEGKPFPWVITGHIKDFENQCNDSDCGVYVLALGEQIVHNK